MCYFMHFDLISSRIFRCFFSPIFAILVRFRGVFRQTRIINECFLMCYFMHFDLISKSNLGVFQPYFWSGLGEFLGVIFFIGKTSI